MDGMNRDATVGASSSLTPDELTQQTLFRAAAGLRRMALVFSDPNQPDNPIVYCNDAFFEQTGYPADEVIGRNCRFLQGPATDQAAVRRIRAALDAGRGINEEIYNYRRDGTGFWNALYISPVLDPAGRVSYFLGSQVDVTGRKLEVLQQQTRLETVGALAAGVAQEFGGLMSAVIASIGQAEDSAVNEQQRLWLGRADQAAREAMRLTQQTFDFARHQGPAAQEVDLNERVLHLDSLLTQVAGPAVDLRLDLSPEPVVGRLDPGGLELALVHLMRNAAAAMPNGGPVTIRVWSYQSWDTSSKQRGQAWVEVAISDTGEGMRSKVAQRAVEPFFSTREGGRGMGLYLTQCFVDQSGGWRRIETTPGRGTTVRLAFPKLEEQERA